MGGGRNLAEGEYSVYQPGQLENLQERRTNMSQIESSTPGVPHLGDSQSFRRTVTTAADKQVGWLRVWSCAGQCSLVLRIFHYILPAASHHCHQVSQQAPIALLP